MKSGIVQKLKVVDEHPKHYWLAEDSNRGRERARLHKGGLTKQFKIGDEIEAFIYTDKKGFLIASMDVPQANVKTVKKLRVKNSISAGAFLDWGKDVDLFWPKNEQRYQVKEGKSYPVVLYTDRDGKLLASGNIYPYLNSDSPYKVDDEVSGTVYDHSGNWGVFVAVDNKYFGLIPKSEIYQDIEYGDVVYARVMRVREDGKLDLALRKRAHVQMTDDSQYILDELDSRNGFINLNDKSSPEEIKRQLRMSKSAFKRAVGRLMKKGLIKTSSRGIKLIDK
ncbi:S1 RNA-binding domain-containing protein [Clostridium sp. 'deep sea']|uniref:CvfB family protein n=1 Tax=Clostridium sp. 'deep sea' TaxID=2779445 RepID=UPI001896631B|nr:S1-like domain-containing RNA-binding protein [Clostridium sp. 'deep sea']QOR34010.1 S1 RNA-binding domain-containing protein [Clostridium sp. 'deep sea']